MITEEIFKLNKRFALIQIQRFTDSVYCWIAEVLHDPTAGELINEYFPFESLVLSFGPNASSCIYGDSFENQASNVAAKLGTEFSNF